MQDFSLSDYYQPGQSDSPEVQAHLDVIRQPGGIQILWDYLKDMSPESRDATLQALEYLTSRCLRNRAILNNLNVAPSLLQLLLLSPPESRERRRIQKSLRRVLELGLSASEARLILQSVILPDDRLHPEVLEVVRGAARGRWPTHISFMSPASLSFSHNGVKALPYAGFTYMVGDFSAKKRQLSDSPQVWLWVEKFPTDNSQNIFAFDIDSTRLISLGIHPDGKLSFKSTAQQEPGVFPNAVIPKARWTHVTLVHYTHRSLNPTIRRYPPFILLECAKSCSGLFIDGVLCDGLNWPYPKNPTTTTSVSYVIGDDTSDATMQWCLSTSYLVSVPLGEFHHMLTAIVAKSHFRQRVATLHSSSWTQIRCKFPV